MARALVLAFDLKSKIDETTLGSISGKFYAKKLIDLTIFLLCIEEKERFNQFSFDSKRFLRTEYENYLIGQKLKLR